jgi:RNA ligase (TIGR02306 family)
MRKLATIRRIADIQPIEGADAIEVATVDGWKVVIKKNEFKVGDLAVYLEIDSWIPHELAPFLSKGQEPREYNGVKGERLRTIKLRGTTSQGLLLKIENCFDVIEKDGRKYINTLDNQTARSSENEDLQDSKQEQW